MKTYEEVIVKAGECALGNELTDLSNTVSPWFNIDIGLISYIYDKEYDNVFKDCELALATAKQEYHDVLDRDEQILCSKVCR